MNKRIKNAVVQMFSLLSFGVGAKGFSYSLLKKADVKSFNRDEKLMWCLTLVDKKSLHANSPKSLEDLLLPFFQHSNSSERVLSDMVLFLPRLLTYNKHHETFLSITQKANWGKEFNTFFLNVLFLSNAFQKLPQEEQSKIFRVLLTSLPLDFYVDLQQLEKKYQAKNKKNISFHHTPIPCNFLDRTLPFVPEDVAILLIKMAPILPSNVLFSRLVLSKELCKTLVRLHPFHVNETFDPNFIRPPPHTELMEKDYLSAHSRNQLMIFSEEFLNNYQEAVFEHIAQKTKNSILGELKIKGSSKPKARM